MHKEDLIILFEYNYWARDKILASASQLEKAQLSETSLPSYESVLGVLTHILNAECLWRDRCQQGISPTSVKFKNAMTSLSELVNEWRDEEHRMVSYLQTLNEVALQKSIEYQGLGGKSYTSLLWQMLVQIVNHGISHRSELAARLTELGFSPGDLDFIIYLRD